MNQNLFYGWLIGVFIILLTSPIGSLIVWKRMSFLGDSLSHASILGVSLSYIININHLFMNFILMLIFLFIIIITEKYFHIRLDAIVSILTNISLSLGSIFLNVVSKEKKIDIPHYLFGDLFHMSVYDVIKVFLISFTILIILSFFWEKFLLIILNQEFAQLQGINVFFMNFILMLIISCSICFAMNFFGILLMTSFLIIPVSISQRFSSSPENSILISIIISLISFTCSIFISYYYNFFISSVIILTLSIFFLISLFFNNKKN
jgi:zinc transport system permease protein